MGQQVKQAITHGLSLDINPPKKKKQTGLYNNLQMSSDLLKDRPVFFPLANSIEIPMGHGHIPSLSHLRPPRIRSTPQRWV